MKNLDGISVRLFGGLGNQLFQYFAGLDASLKMGSKLTVDMRWIDASYSQSESDIRDFEFSSSLNLISGNESSKLNFTIERLKTIIARSSRIASDFLALNSPTHAGYIDLTKIEVGVELRGYYQAYKYFESVSRVIDMKNWSLKSESNIFLKMKLKLESQPFIAIHVRGGDYLKKGSINHILHKEYYEEGLKKLKVPLGEIKVYVFSDEIDYAKNMLKDLPGLLYLNQKGLRASEAMLLMSLAKGMIIANSTFSYWAAVINTSGSIIAPKYWYTDSEVDKELYPKKWVQI
jgi:hypothetical protein